MIRSGKEILRCWHLGKEIFRCWYLLKKFKICKQNTHCYFVAKSNMLTDQQHNHLKSDPRLHCPQEMDFSNHTKDKVSGFL